MTPGIGETLREARRARGIELAEVEQATKIRGRFLRAIEDEQWDALPGRAYARGFLRTYAELVEVDPDPLLELLERDLEPVEEEEIPPEPVVQRGTISSGILNRIRPRLVAAVVGAALVVALLILGLTSGGVDDEVAAPPPPPAEEAEEAEEVDEPSPPPEEPARVSLRLNAVGTVWVCLVDGRGEGLVDSETLVEGESRGPFEARRLLMTFGNGQIEVLADGEAFDVPDAAEPLGYEVTPEGVTDLEPAERPTCT